MSSEYRLSKWSVRFSPEAQPEVYERETDRAESVTVELSYD